jgi:hypothetical protein
MNRCARPAVRRYASLVRDRPLDSFPDRANDVPGVAGDSNSAIRQSGGNRRILPIDAYETRTQMLGREAFQRIAHHARVETAIVE